MTCVSVVLPCAAPPTHPTPTPPHTHTTTTTINHDWLQDNCLAFLELHGTQTVLNTVNFYTSGVRWAMQLGAGEQLGPSVLPFAGQGAAVYELLLHPLCTSPPLPATPNRTAAAGLRAGRVADCVRRRLPPDVCA